MKRILFLLSLIVCQWTSLSAQTLSPDVQAVYDACLQMATAIGAGNTTGLKAANTAYKKCNTTDFSSLRCQSESPLSLDGHFVFNEDFVDSLIAGRDVYKFAQRYARQRGVRGASTSGKVFTRNCAVKGKQSERFTFVSRGHQELAVVAEPGGKLTLSVHDKTNGKWYKDTRDVKRGRNSRCLVFDLPDTKNTLEVEVINCGANDCSFVVISN